MGDLHHETQQLNRVLRWSLEGRNMDVPLRLRARFDRRGCGSAASAVRRREEDGHDPIQWVMRESTPDPEDQ